MKKEMVYALPLWEGDRIFFRLLEKTEDVFTLKLRYEGNVLVERAMNGKPFDDLAV